MDYVPIIIIFCCWVVTISHCKSACQGTKTFFCGCFLLLFKGKEIISKVQIKLGCQQEGDEVGWGEKKKHEASPWESDSPSHVQSHSCGTGGCVGCCQPPRSTLMWRAGNQSL